MFQFQTYIVHYLKYQFLKLFYWCISCSLLNFKNIPFLCFSLFSNGSRFSFSFCILASILSVQSRFCYAMKSRTPPLLRASPFFSQNSVVPLSIMKREISGKLIHIRKSIFNRREGNTGISVARNCTTLFFLLPLQSPGLAPPPNHPPSATAEMRCEIFNLVYPVATPSSEPLPLLNLSHPTLALPSFLPFSSPSLAR